MMIVYRCKTCNHLFESTRPDKYCPSCYSDSIIVDEFRDDIKENSHFLQAKKIVDSWPKWKREIAKKMIEIEDI